MTRTVDKLSFTLSIRAPQNKNKIFTLLCQTMYNRIGKLLPALVLMRTGLMRSYRKRSIEQQHPLIGPPGKIAAHGNRRTDIIVYLLEDILQRRRKRNAVIYRKTKTMRLSRFVIRILPENNHFHLVERTGIKSGEHLAARRIYPRSGILMTHKVGK